MIGTSSGIDLGLLASVYLGLFCFGLAFNQLMAWLDRGGYLHGYTSLAVAIGCLATIGMTALINPWFALITAGAFMASGAPMIIGSAWRHASQREKELERMRKEIQGDDAP